MKIYSNFDLTNYNSYNLKSHCKTAYFPENDEDIHILFKKGATKKILIGGGFNILLSKEYYEEEFVLFNNNYDDCVIDGNSLVCEAGCDMKSISAKALQSSLSGLEMFYDIPSSLGGAIVMNAGAGGEDIQKYLQKVTYYNPNKDAFVDINKDQIGFEYRNSFFQKNPEMIVCRAYFTLIVGVYSEINSKMQKLKESRWAKQPREYPNAGSVFKRPPGRFVGPMIDELGLKGLTIGGAKISEKHSGFIINYNNATGMDIINIINLVKQKVLDRFEVDLEVEQRII